jgi:hypothetical protein
MHDKITAVDPYYGFANSCFPALLKQEKPLVVEPCGAPEFTGRCFRLAFRLVSKVATQSRRVTIEMLEYFLYTL